MYISPVNISANNKSNPAFGSALLARVVSRTVNKNGDISYKVIDGVEHGTFNSFARNINSLAKKKLSGTTSNSVVFKNILEKLSAVIKDLNVDNPFVRTTNVRMRSHNKKFILTGAEARMIDDFGKDCIGALGNKRVYKDIVESQIYHNMKNRVMSPQGNELGIDLIVDAKTGKIADVDILPVSDLFKLHKSALIKKQIDKNNPAAILNLYKQPMRTQGLFSFMDEIASK